MSGDRSTADGESRDGGATAGETVPDDLRGTLADRLDGHDRLVLCLDFDGTLAPIVEDPSEATIRSGNRETLRTLRDHPAVRVAVVSGRALDDVRERVGVEGIDYVGNAGLERSDDDERRVHRDARRAEERLDRLRETLADELGWTAGVTIEDKRWSLAVHTRNAPDGHHDRVAETVGRVADRLGEFDVSRGREVLEVGPATDASKGTAVADLAGEHDDPLVVYVGDDRSDPTAFDVATDGGVGVFVGTEGPAAAHRVESPEAVSDLLDWLATHGVERLADD